jgi:hypothetical protein
MKALRLVFPWFLSVSLMAVLAHPLPAQQAAATPAPAPSAAVPGKAAAPAAPAVAASEESTLPGSITFGLHFGDQDVESFGDVLVPVLMFKSGLLFADVRGSVTDYDEQEMNLGLGYRHLLDDKNMIVGGNVFYDRRTTRYDNTFDQLGLGVEFLSKWVDARVNYYLPEEDAKAADDYVTSDSQVTEQNSHWQAPEGMGHTIQQWGYTVTDTYDVKTLHQFRSYEQALEGFDCEIGGLLPIPFVQDYADVKAFAGYYAFDANVGDDIEGFKGRLEVRPMPALYLDALYFEDEELFGSHYSVGLRATLPFDLANLSRGRNPFKGAMEGFKPGKSQAPFSSRLSDLVVRDLHVRTDQTEPEEIVENQRVLSKTQTGHSRQEYLETLFTDVTFVDDDNMSGIENGSWEYPYRVIQDGVDKRVGAMVYVRDAAAQYQENVRMEEGLTLWGSGCPIYGRDSRFLGGVYPVVNGGGNGPAITLASHTTLAGFEITQPEWLAPVGNKKPNGYEMAGIYGYNVTDVDIHCNYIHGSGMTTPGIAIDNNYPMASFEGWIWNNRIDDVRGDGIRLQFNDIRDVDVMLANNNVTRADGHGLYLDAHSDYDGEGFFLARISGNYSDNAHDGVYLNARGYDTAAALFVDTTANNNGSVGIAAYLSADYMAGALFASHEDLDRLDQLVNTVLGGIGFLPMDMGDVSVTDLLGVRDLYCAGGSMQANGNGQSGIALYQWSDYLNLAAVIGAQTDDNGWGGHDIESDKQGGWGGTYVYQQGYDGYNDYGYDTAEYSVAALIRCQANNNYGPGLYLNSYGDELALGVLMDVTANRNSNCGIRGSFYSPYGAAGALVMSSDPMMNLIGNLTANPLLGDFVSPMDMSFIPPYGQVQANGNGGSGINIDAYGDDAAFAIVLDAQANENGQMGGVPTQKGSIGAGIQLNLSTDYFYYDDDDDDGVAIGIVASTESLMGMIQPAIDEMGLPVDVSGVSTLGPVQANNNAGMGVQIHAHGGDSIVGVIGVEALNNGWMAGIVSGKNGYYGDGIDIQVSADNGDAMVGLADVNASGNNGVGIHVDAVADSDWGEAMIGGVGITANENQYGGLELFASSQAPASSYLVLAGVEANGNVHGSGIDATVYGRGTAAAALQAIEANGNGEKGIWVEVDSYEGDAHVWMGETAVSDMNVHMNGWDSSIFDEIIPMLPEGGIEASGNGETGVRINADAWGGNVLVDVGDVIATGNGYSLDNYGLDVTEVDLDEDNHAGIAVLTESAWNADISVDDSLLVGNTGNGLRVRAQAENELIVNVSGVTSASNGNSGVKAVLDAGGLLAADFTQNAMLSNGKYGFRINADSDTRLELFGEGNQARMNGENGFDLTTKAPSGNRVYDFGGGALGSLGNNSFTGNGGYGMLRRDGAGRIYAQGNYWDGNVMGDTSVISGGAIDSSYPLATDPNP